MNEPASARDLRFLYRSDQGVIDRSEWRRGAAILVGILIAFAVGWRLLSPYANRGLDERKLIDAMTIVTFTYLSIYAFAVLLLSVSYVNLSIKRLRARGQPTALAGLLPLAALIAGAAHWLQPRVADAMPWGIVVACDLVLLAVLVWSLIELGFRES